MIGRMASREADENAPNTTSALSCWIRRRAISWNRVLSDCVS